MTTIAYDGRSIAADKLETFPRGERCPHPVQKIMRASIPGQLGHKEPIPGNSFVDKFRTGRQRVLLGFSGSLLEARMLLLHYVEAPRVLGQPITNPPENGGNLLVIHLDHDPETTVMIGSRGGISICTGTPMTSGSGGEFAMGAMLAGKSAHQAVEIAALRDVFTGNGVDSVLIAAAKSEPVENFPFYLD